MMGKWILLFFVLAIGSNKSCNKNAMKNKHAKTDSTIQEIVIKEPPISVSQDSSLQLKNSILKDSLLVLTIRYIGHADDKIEFISDGMILKTLPPRLIIYPQHIVSNKQHLAEHTKTILLNIAPYQPKENDLHLIFKGLKIITLKK